MVRQPTLTIENIRGPPFPVTWETAAKLFCTRERLLSSSLSGNYNCCGGYFGPSYWVSPNPRHCTCRTAAVVDEVFNADFEAMKGNPISSGPPLPTGKYQVAVEYTESLISVTTSIRFWTRAYLEEEEGQEKVLGCRARARKRYHASATFHVHRFNNIRHFLYTPIQMSRSFDLVPKLARVVLSLKFCCIQEHTPQHASHLMFSACLNDR